MNVTVDESMIGALLDTARNENEQEDARRAALRHACQLRGDNYQHVPLEHLRFVAAAMRYSEVLRGPTLSLKDAAEATAAGFARRGTPSIRR